MEGLLRLRRLVGDAVDVTLLAPNEELRYRPVAVQEPFSRPSAKRYPLRDVARKANAEWVRDGLEWVDPDDQVAHTAEGARSSTTPCSLPSEPAPMFRTSM